MPDIRILRKLFLYSGILCLAVSQPAHGKAFAGMESFPVSNPASPLKIVKERVINYLLGGSGAGIYRRNAVQENDRWVETILKKRFQPVIWDTNEELRMNSQLNDLAIDLKRLSIAFRSKGSRMSKVKR